MPLQAGSQRHEVTARLLVDCMGHYSPVVKQMRGGAKPQGMVLVVGTCAEGVPADRNRCSLLPRVICDDPRHESSCCSSP